MYETPQLEMEDPLSREYEEQNHLDKTSNYASCDASPVWKAQEGGRFQNQIQLLDSQQKDPRFRQMQEVIIYTKCYNIAVKNSS